MDENHNKTVLTGKQKFKLHEKFDNGEVTKLAKNCGVGIA
jgi:hypothetical protein